MRSAARFATAVVFILALPMVAVSAQAYNRPNIILIMTDDSGYSDIGAYGGEIDTPNIDTLARHGLRFQRFYTNAKCSPTRASLLTGQYPHNVGVGDLARVIDETPFPGYRGYLDQINNVTIAEALKEAGYSTLMSGKWHLGGEKEVNGMPAKGEELKWPLARGFDRFFGLIHGAADYYTPKAPRVFRLGDEIYLMKPGSKFYATDVITDYAIDFIKEASQQNEKPFFLYVAYTAPHTPRQAPDALVHKYTEVYQGDWNVLQTQRFEKLKQEGLISANWNKPPPIKDSLKISNLMIHNMALHAAMIEKVDENVGRLMQALHDINEYDNTLVIYLSDNGAEWPVAPLSNTPFHGEKASLREGGLVTHFLMHWPDGIRKVGQIIRQPAHVIDVMPTLLDIGEAEYPAEYRDRQIRPADGKSFSRVFQEGQWEGHDVLYWDLYGWHAVLAYPWKYVRNAKGYYELYDIEQDGVEHKNVVAQNPEKMWQLASMHSNWAMKNNVMPYDIVKQEQKKSGKQVKSQSWIKQLLLRIADKF